ncbi:TPA: winged helix-turn-helix domain-containing protein [Stenotrophomonas maltophilia]|nr:winged helix-turn-helix domain-containing protein [Stenotrophomonas maltophilia]
MNESARYRFGEFCLIPSRRELWHAGRLRPVQPKVFDTLAYLLGHADRAIGRDELVAAVWGRAEVADNVLSQIVARARQAIGDSGDEQHSIRTVPRFGYQWVRAVEASHTVVDPRIPCAPPVPSLAAVPAMAPAFRRRCVLASAPLALAVVGFAVIACAVNGYRRGAADPLASLRAAVTLDRLDQARAVIRTLSDQDRARPEVRQQAALLVLKEGRASDALNAFRTLAADLGSSGNPAWLGEAWYGAGLAAARQEDVEAAQRYYTEAVVHLANAGPAGRPALGRAWTGLGRIQATCRAFDDAERAYAQAHSALEGTGDVAALAQLESSVGVLLIGRYRHSEALPLFARAADLAAEIRDVGAETRARMNLVNAHLALLQPAAALASEPRLRELRERVGDPWLARHVDLVRVKVLTANGRLGEADAVVRAHTGWPKPDDPSLTGPWDVVAADLAYAREAWELGNGLVKAALDSPWYAPESGLAAYARYRLLTARDALGDRLGVADAARAADAQSRERPAEPTIRLYALLARGEADAATGRVAEARTAFAAALDQAEATHVPFDVVQVADAYVRFLLRHGDATAARTLADRLAAWADTDYRASLVQLSVYHATGSDAWQPALARTRRLAGERKVPAALTVPPVDHWTPDTRVALASRTL